MNYWIDYYEKKVEQILNITDKEERIRQLDNRIYMMKIEFYSADYHIEKIDKNIKDDMDAIELFENCYKRAEAENDKLMQEEYTEQIEYNKDILKKHTELKEYYEKVKTTCPTWIKELEEKLEQMKGEN